MKLNSPFYNPCILNSSLTRSLKILPGHKTLTVFEILFQKKEKNTQYNYNYDDIQIFLEESPIRMSLGTSSMVNYLYC